MSDYHAHHSGSHAGHGHEHGGGSSVLSHGAAAQRPLKRALVLTGIVAVAEVVGGVVTNSLALLADAGHMVTDVAALGLALFAAWLGRRPPQGGQTYGGLRWEVLAAWVNGAALVGLSSAIIFEALGRLREPPPVTGGLMLVVAIIGLTANAISAWWLHGASAHSLNVRGAYLHVLGDLAGSVATIVAALLLMYFDWGLADPIASIAVSLLVLVGAWRLVRDATEILLEATPRHIDLNKVRIALESIPGVHSVHDLHVWTVGGGVIAMSAHAVLDDGHAGHTALEDARTAMARFGVGHVTIQLEQPALEGCGDCATLILS